MQKIDSKILEQTLEISVADYYLYDPISGVEVFSGSLSTHSLDKQVGDGEKVAGGRNGDTLYTIPAKSEFKIEVVDRYNNQMLEAMKMGTLPVEVGTKTGLYSVHKPQTYIVETETSKLVVKLSNTPLEGEIVRAYKNNGSVMIEPTKAVLSSDRTKLEITDTDVVAGSKVFVTGFKYAPAQDTLMSVIKSDASSPSFLCMMEVPLFNSSMEVVKIKKYVFPKVQLNASSSSKGQSEKKGLEAQTTLEVLKSPLEELGYIFYEQPK